MKRAIWGAGNSGFLYLHRIGVEKIDFFIDSNPQKRGLFCRKKVYHPNDIKNWMQLYIYIPAKYYNEISNFLVQKGLKENENFISFQNTKYISYSEGRKIVAQSIINVKKALQLRERQIVFLGMTWCMKFEHDILMALVGNGLNIAVVANDLDKGTINEHALQPILSVPLTWDGLIINEGKLGKACKKIMNKNAYFSNVTKTLAEVYRSHAISFEHCECIVWCIYLYIKALLHYLKPYCFICHSTVSPQNELLLYLCLERRIKVLSMHQGVIPGTVTFDNNGDVGESLPAICGDKFSNLAVSESDLKASQRVWEYLYASKLNRVQQPKTDCLDYIRNKVNSKYPIIFFAGQNDGASRMVPYTKHSQKFQSPIFKSSIEACSYLACLCKKNHWNLICKPHPLYIQSKFESEIPSNVIYIENGDINDLIDISDVTITILSSTNYIALIRHKPVVMLGYNQIRGKGCAYEAFQKEHIEKAIMDALQYGFTKEQQAAFLKHMAQCLKYYLYDDLQDRPIRYGRALPKCIDDFFLLEKALGVENKKNTFEDELHEL